MCGEAVALVLVTGCRLKAKVQGARVAEWPAERSWPGVAGDVDSEWLAAS